MGTMLDAYRKRMARLGLLPTMVCLRVVASTPGAIEVLRKAA